MPDPSPQSSAPTPATPEAVPQSSIAVELSRVYDEKSEPAKAPEKAGTPTAISPGQGNVSDAPKRDEGGRFAAKDPKSEAKADAKPEPKAEGKVDAKVEAKTEPKVDPKAVDTKEPPKDSPKPHPRWKPEVQERFSKLAAADPDLAKFVLERQGESEKQFTQARQAVAQVTERFKSLEDVLAPGRQQRSMQGVDDPTYLRALVSASDYLAKDPRSGLKMLAEQYGVDLKELADGAAANPQDSPQVRELQRQVAEMREYINRANEGAKTHALHGAMQSIQAFAQAKDESGQLLHPHFEQVVDDVTAIVARQLESGQQPDLKAAYQKAIRLNDAIWTKTQAETAERERKQREADEARRVEEARRAGFSVSGSGGGSDVVADSIHAELARQVDKAFR